MSSNLTRLTIPDGVAGNISEFESDVLSSNLSPVADVVSSLSGKAAHCECEEQGSIPGDNQKMAYSLTDKNAVLRTQR